MSIERLSKYLKTKGDKIILTLGEFLLTNQIGQGGNGLVYEANFLDKIVAIKFLITEATGKTKQQKQERFIAEYYNIITINDLTNIVRYIDYDILKIADDIGELEIPIIIMKRYDGSLVKQQETNSEEEFKNLFKFLLNTIDNIHNEGIIHRDIKPENILVESGKFILADFGIANYNPEIFKVRAETDKKERLGNRLFSAPEQEEKGVEPNPTMDIYAIGQVLQWYATGKTHRGTNRQRITTVYKDLGTYDNVIEICLSQNPLNRFQNISEIFDYIERSREKDIFEYMSDFNRVLRSNFPKNNFGIVHSSDRKRIDRLFQTFKDNEDKFDRDLWWQDGLGNLDFTLTRKGEAIWKFEDREYSINEVWIHYDNSDFNDFVLVHYLPSEPFNVDGEYIFDTTIVDDEHHISYSEYQNGFAEINEKIIDLSKHKVEFNVRQQLEGYFFIGTRYHCILRTKNDSNVRDFIQKLKDNDGKLDIGEFKKFAWEVRKHKLPEVLMRL